MSEDSDLGGVSVMLTNNWDFNLYKEILQSNLFVSYYSRFEGVCCLGFLLPVLEGLGFFVLKAACNQKN